MLMPPKLRWILLSFSALSSNTALANGLHSTVGYYSLNAKTSNGRLTLSNLGVYRFLYEVEVAKKFSFKPAYSLYTIATASGLELGYGTDLEFSYFPIANNSPMSYQNSNISWDTYEIFRPYVSLSFHQRQYQAIQSNYAGLGFQVGCSFQYNQSIQITAYGAFINLVGPLSSRIGEIQVGTGVGIKL